MVLGVKSVVSIEFKIVKPQDCIEMLIYCLYITRLFNIDGVLGCVTDRKVWHVLRVSRSGNELSIKGLHDLCKFRRRCHCQYRSLFIELSLTITTNLTFHLPL